MRDVHRPWPTWSRPHLLIIEARFYDDLADELARAARIAALERAGATYERVAVPGALEIPAALAMALEAMERGEPHYDGFVVLGCVIRGETTPLRHRRRRVGAGASWTSPSTRRWRSATAS